MRVVVATGIYPPDIGGPATHSANLSAELRRRGHQVAVLTVTDEGRTVWEPGVVRHPRRWPWPVRTAAGVWWLVRHRRSYDVIYASGLDLAGVVAGVVVRRPVVVKVVGDAAWERSAREGLTTDGFEAFQAGGGGGMRLRAMRAVRTWTARRATAVITPSAYLRDVVQGWTGGRDVVVVPNGAPPNPHAGAVAAEADGGPLRLLFVGRLVDHKRVGVLVEAVARTPGARLEVVGDGPERDALVSLAGRRGVADRVVFAGPLAADETQRRVAAAHALVNASSYEGLPHVAVEAVVAGVPVVCSAAGGAVEVVDDGRNGVVVADATPDGFAAVFARLRDDRAGLAALAEGAREVAPRWTFARCADQVEAVLVEAAAAGTGEGAAGDGRDPDRPVAVYVGRAVPYPPSDELRRKFALHSSLLRQVSVTTAARPGVHDVSGVRLLAFPQLRPPLLGGALFYAAAPLVAVPRALGRRHAAIVCQSPYEALGVIALNRLVPRQLRPRVQVELHGDWRTAPRLYGSRARAVLGPACDRACEWALRRADRVRAVSDVLAGQARAAGYGGPLDQHFTYSDFSAFLRTPPAPVPERPRALFIGVLERYKAVDLLLDAWPEVAARVPGAELVIVGSGTLGPELRRRAAEMAGVGLREPMTQPELAELLDRSTCLVLPSRSEGLPRVVMEAMARGRAVVASDVGGMRELVEEGVTGRLVPSEDVVALAEALAAVLEDRAGAERMGAAARERAEGRNPVEEYAAGMRRLAAWIAER